jgi:GTPase SAR1 family protein
MWLRVDDMGNPVAVFNLGTAGCGKSTLTGAMGNWLSDHSYSGVLVNLDPGAEALPYEPDIDVRDWITIRDVMDEYGLGPNGAQVVAADMLALHLNKVLDLIDEDSTQYVVIDTPGQIELFSFRESSKEFVKRLYPETSYMIFLIDPFNSRSPSGLVSQLMLYNLSKLRFQLPSMEFLSKGDMIEPGTADNLDRWMDFPPSLLDDLVIESSGGSRLNVEFAIEMFKAIETMALFAPLRRISAVDMEGIDWIFQTIQLTYGIGDDPGHVG